MIVLFMSPMAQSMTELSAVSHMKGSAGLDGKKLLNIGSVVTLPANIA